jgi:hypothetical protein
VFTANVASVLIEQSLRSREFMSLEMSDHLVLCTWSPRAIEWIREVHSDIVVEKRPVVLVHDNADEVELPDKRDDPAFNDVYIVKGDPANEVILKRARVPTAHSVVILADDRQRIGVSLSTLYALKDQGLLRPVRCGVSKGFRWSEEAIEAFLQTRQEDPVEEPQTPASVKLKHIKV